MKFYCKTTSERATKGQGGNDFLDIKITIDDNGEIKTLTRMVLNETDTHYILVEDSADDRIIATLEKGKK